MEVGNVEDENTFLQCLNVCGLSPPSCNSTVSPPSTVALSTEGAKFMFLLQSLLISLLEREVQTSAGGPVRGLSQSPT